jgi:hypothetical protein
VRVALVALSVAAALVAVVHGARHTWPDLGYGHPRLTAAEADRIPAVHEGLPLGLFDRWQMRLHPGERWWLDVAPGAPEGLTVRGAVYRAYAVYAFLPNLPASSRAGADVVFVLRSPR